MRKIGRGARSAAIAVAIVLSPAFIAIDTAHAAACVTTQNSYTGNGTNGTNGVSYTTFTISTVGACQFTVPAGVTQADVLIVGGGGGGAGGYSMASATGGGGGGGGAMVASNYPLTPLANISVTVGAGGAGGVSINSANRDSTVGAQGSNTVFDAITAGGGGGGGYSSATGYTYENGRAGTAGGGAGGASNHWNAYNASSVVASGGTGTSVTVGGQTYPGITGGAGGIYVAGQNGSDTSGSGGGAVGAAVNGSSPAPGSAFSSYVSGTQTSYGGGGLAYGATNWTVGGTPTGYGFGGWGGQSTTNGSDGNAGIVLIRILTQAVGINSFGLSGAATSSTYRGATTISINVTGASKVTFLAAGKKIPGCVKVSTSGTSPNIIANCTWRPSVHGSMRISAIVYPLTGVSSTTSSNINIGITKRSNTR